MSKKIPTFSFSSRARGCEIDRQDEAGCKDAEDGHERDTNHGQSQSPVTHQVVESKLHFRSDTNAAQACLASTMIRWLVGFQEQLNGIIEGRVEIMCH